MNTTIKSANNTSPSTPTLILKHQPYTTQINFMHCLETDQQRIVQELNARAQTLTQAPGFIAVNILQSTEGSRICTYTQWQTNHSQPALELGDSSGLQNEAKAREYEVFYTDDRSSDGISVISNEYQGVIFINEITTIPGPKQLRLLELVVANNEKDSLVTPGYRSANFHRSLDGERAVNYSLWDSEEHLIEAISAMAAQDVNLEETIQIASPDFRFYTLAFAAHA
jgi:heme-degrading monooxygenase HmoA